MLTKDKGQEPELMGRLNVEMRYLAPLLLFSACLAAFGQPLCAADRSNDYQIGTYIGSSRALTGAIIDDFSCSSGPGSRLCTGGAYRQRVTVYKVQTADGYWAMEAFVHFGGAKRENPLDLLKANDAVMFRVERHRKLGGVETDVAIPYADNPNKEEKFVASFHPSAAPVEKPKGPSDNVRAMCDAHKLSPTLEKQLCAQPPASATVSPALEPVITNSEAANDSPAAAAALASVGHASSPQELAELVQKGQASKCAVMTMPPGAEVSVDGNKLGVSPVAFVLLKQGDTPRTVTVKMSGDETVEKNSVPDGRLIPIALTLKKE